MKKATYTVEMMERALVDGYMATGKDMTQAEVAERMGCSQATVKKLLDECFGCPRGFVCREEVRASYSRNYPGFQSGSHRVWVYGPSRETLRGMLMSVRAPATVEAA